MEKRTHTQFMHHHVVCSCEKNRGVERTERVQGVEHMHTVHSHIHRQRKKFYFGRAKHQYCIQSVKNLFSHYGPIFFFKLPTLSRKKVRISSNSGARLIAFLGPTL